MAAAQRLNVAGDQRTVADKGAAGISIAAGKRERAVAGFAMRLIHWRFIMNTLTATSVVLPAPRPAINQGIDINN
ncbi:hypothetical protein MJI32_20425, partial [Salmonella enterica subsp. enterica serovar Lubbock]|nr:hypothetical protein [Salmonella enterica subsp. enterica serovar Lubbock]